MTQTALSTATVEALRQTLDHLLAQPKGSDHRFPCGSPREAQSVRARMNRLRATDRQQAMSVYAQYNRQQLRMGLAPEPIPASANRSRYDDLIFRVVGSDLHIMVGGMTASEFLALAGLTLPDVMPDREVPQAPPEAPASPITGSYDTAPRSDEDPFAPANESSGE